MTAAGFVLSVTRKLLAAVGVTGARVGVGAIGLGVTGATVPVARAAVGTAGTTVGAKGAVVAVAGMVVGAAGTTVGVVDAPHAASPEVTMTKMVRNMNERMRYSIT